MSCDAFFLQILPKLRFISAPWSDFLGIVTTELLQLWWLSQVVGPGFEAGLVLEFFCFRASRSWVRTSLSPYFLCKTCVAENIPVRLVINISSLYSEILKKISVIQFVKMDTSALPNFETPIPAWHLLFACPVSR